jgi:hypothetical protein
MGWLSRYRLQSCGWTDSAWKSMVVPDRGAPTMTIGRAMSLVRSVCRAVSGVATEILQLGSAA